MITVKREKPDILMPVHNDPQFKNVYSYFYGSSFILYCFILLYTVLYLQLYLFFSPVYLKRGNCSPKTFLLIEMTLISNESAKN